MWSACLDEYQHAVGWHYDLVLFGGNGWVLILAQGFWICCLTSRRVLVVFITFYMDGVFPFAAFATALCG